MPRQRNPSRLQPLCLKQIVELLWQWRLNSRAKFPDEVDQIMKDYFHLPAVFTESILDGLKDDHFLYTGHVTLLVKLGLAKLSIVGDYYVDFDQVMKYTSHCMQHIVSLDISRHWLPSDTMTKLTETFPNVEVLRLQFTRLNDDNLVELGKNCPRLRVLDVSFCPVTDAGVLELCVRCPNLKKLYISDSKVSVEGAASILEKFPQLEELGVNSMVDVLACLHASQLHAGCLDRARKHCLRNIRFVLESKCARIKEGSWSQDNELTAIAESFQIVSETCPELRDVTVNHWHPQQEWCLQMLSRCRHLSQIELDVKSYPNLTMDAVYPLLSNLYNLENLTMRHVDNVNMTLLSCICNTHLRSMTLEENTYVSTHAKDAMPNFEQLEILTLIGKFPEDVLFLTLTLCPAVRELEITNNYNLTQELLMLVLVRNPLPCLKILILHDCDRFNLQSLKLFLQSDNDLCDVEIHNCRISYTQYNQFLHWMATNMSNAAVEFDFESQMGNLLSTRKLNQLE